MKEKGRHICAGLIEVGLHDRPNRECWCCAVIRLWRSLPRSERLKECKAFEILPEVVGPIPPVEWLDRHGVAPVAYRRSA